MQKSLVRLLTLFVLIVPLLAACGRKPAAVPTTVPAATAAATAAATVPPAATAAATEAATAAPTVAATAAATTEATTTPTAAGTNSSKPRVALVTDTGKVNDGTFNQFAYEGAKKATDELGLEFTYIETQASADYVKNIQTLVDEKYDVIITVGFLLADATQAAAAAHPEIAFIGVDQTYSSKAPVATVATAAEAPTVPATEDSAMTNNLVTLRFREDQAGFLAGALAGMMTKSGTVGIVAGMEIPPVKKYRNGYENGAKYVNPNVNPVGVYVPSFSDSALGASTAEQMIGDGADVIFGAGGQTGSGGIKAAAAKGVYVIGVDQDEYAGPTFQGGKAPGSAKVLTSAIKRVDVAVYDQIKAIAGGTFKGKRAVIYEAKDNGVGLAPYHGTDAAISAAVKARIDEIQKALADGTLTTGVDPISGDVDEKTVPTAKPFKP
ncbi:MAG: BMP family ABC transporter substrate-binding protein [Chloroflexales bacterium]